MNTFNLSALMERAESYLQAAKQVKTDNSIDAIHDFRIASRSILALEPLLRTVGKTGKWSKPARQWLKTLNPLRDLQMMEERLNGERSLHKELRADIQRELEKWQAIRPGIANDAFRKHLEHSLEQFQHRCATQPGYFSVTVLALWWQTLGQVQTRLVAVDIDDPRTLHRLRVAFKNLRYLTNTLRQMGIVPEDANAGLKYWHDLLGDIQDRCATENWLRRKGMAATLPAQQVTEALALVRRFREEQMHFQTTLLRLDTLVIASQAQQLQLISSAAVKPVP
jgi:CHAD domain-containing protein